MTLRKPVHRWVFRARLVKVVDGDTIVAQLDLGMDTVRTVHIRLLEVFAPEIRGPESVAGNTVKAWVRDWFGLFTVPDNGWPILIETFKDRNTDKYGRFIGRVWVEGRCLNTEIVTAGLATVTA